VIFFPHQTREATIFVATITGDQRIFSLNVGDVELLISEEKWRELVETVAKLVDMGS
jgi:hypothetical protein